MPDYKDEPKATGVPVGPEAKADNGELKLSWTSLAEKLKDVPQIATLSHRQKLFISAIAMGWPQARAAKALGTNVSTIEKWLKRPENDVIIAEIQYRMGIRPVSEYFRSQLMPSIRTMIEIRDNRELDSNVRLRAAQLITEFAIGKPTQTVENKGMDLKTLLRDVRKRANETSEIRTTDVVQPQVPAEKH